MQAIIHTPAGSRATVNTPDYGWLEVGVGLGIASGLVACGGGDGDSGARAMLQVAEPPVQPQLLPVAAKAVKRSAQQAFRTPLAIELMDWAEREFPHYFDHHEADRYE